MERSVRWLDRCIAFHNDSGKIESQNLFAIVQGGLDPGLRDRCLDAMIERKNNVAGYAIGGLSGGEEKGGSSSSIPRRLLMIGQIFFGKCRLRANMVDPIVHKLILVQHQTMYGQIA